jgi:uncharacterized membrane protein
VAWKVADERSTLDTHEGCWIDRESLMSAVEVLGFVNLFWAGLLAGEEFVIRFGVRAPVASLDERAHIQLRQALIRRLRVVVPAIFGITVLTAVAATVLGGFGLGFGLRSAGGVALLTWLLVTLLGTVPINQAVLAWEPSVPPKNWRAQVSRWERLDTVRCWAALAAFALFLTAMARQLSVT